MSGTSWWHRLIHPITAHFRKKRGSFLHQQFPKIREYKICDLGGSRHFWEKVALDIPPGNITVFNISDSETQTVSDKTEDDIKVVLYDGNKIPAANSEFDLLVCNSVLEHVPPAARASLAAEMRRVAKHVFCQTPAYSFPIEPHFILPFVHWLPRKLGFWLAHVSPWRLLSRPSPENIREYWWGTELLSEKEIRQLFPNARIGYERALGLTKSYYVIQDC
jgi:2-polyprenyl-3-methyl-5-hydroxy-6-metoxy-1,4-benzoquinol methylase